MGEPYCPQHHPRTYHQCGCPLPKRPAKPLTSDVCKWCLNFSYATCGNREHWKLVREQYEKDLERWEQTYGERRAERRAEKPAKPETPMGLPLVSTPRAPRPAVVVVLPPNVREFLANAGRIGGLSRSERKIAASRLNARRGGRPRGLQ